MPPNAPDQRLQELADACRTGDPAGTELTLRDWLREGDAPEAAAVLLAALQARRGDLRAACDTLDAVIDLQHPPAIRLTMALLLQAGLEDDARALADRARNEFGATHPLLAWMTLMAVPGLDVTNPGTVTPPDESAVIDRLTSQLAAGLEALPSIIIALQHEPNPQSITRLRLATAPLVDEPSLEEERGLLCASLAELARLDEDTDNTARWARRALALEPFNARMALVLSEASEVQVTVLPNALDALHQVHEAHPTYPDVHAALIRREHTGGRTVTARDRLAAWLTSDPQNPSAHRLSQELAA